MVASVIGGGCAGEISNSAALVAMSTMCKRAEKEGIEQKDQRMAQSN